MAYLCVDPDPDLAFDGPFFKSSQIPSRHGWYYFGIMIFKKVSGAG
jgi:hypothetical protein